MKNTLADYTCTFFCLRLSCYHLYPYRHCKVSVILLYLLLLLSNQSFLQAQVLQAAAGARSRSMANTCLSFQDEWAVFQNPAGLAGISGTLSGVSVENRYSVPGLFNSFASFSWMPSRNTGIGVGLFRFGDRFYNDHRLALGAGHQIGGARIGGRLNMLQFSMNDLNTRLAFTADAGVWVALSPELSIGAELNNLNQAALQDVAHARLPVSIRLGVAWQALPNLLLQSEAFKDLDWPVSMAVGLEYGLLEQLLVRAGTQIGLDAQHAAGMALFSFGLGYRLAVFKVAYASQIIPRIGFSHTLSLAYTLPVRQKKNVPSKATPPDE